MFLACAAGVSAVAGEPCSVEGYSWQKLEAAFQKAKAPVRRDLSGNWVMTGFVMTQEFGGGHRKDIAQSDCHGIKRNGELEWTLKFSVTPDDGLVVDSKKVGDAAQSRRVSFEANGDLIFEQDDMGDSNPVYRCRMAGSQGLICVYKGAAGHGMEFRKQEK
jgi:hypothetical protein